MSSSKKISINKKTSKKASRSYSSETVVKLWVRAGGRCELNGCNDYLLMDDLTLKESNLSNIAHIVGLKGPRSEDPLSMEKRNEVENLMLACKKHHGIFDHKKWISLYPKEKLLQMKQAHEERIFRQTGIQPDAKTFAICFKSKIAGEIVQVPLDQIENAVYPRYPMQKNPLEIDLTGLPDTEDETLWKIGMGIISERLTKYYHPEISSGTIKHISVFGLAPIPLLIFLGNQLSNKVTTDLYQRHRNPEEWKWKIDGNTAKYKTRIMKSGDDKLKVALVLSLSGPTEFENLPKEVKNHYTIYEITLDGLTPNTGFLRKREDLAGFQIAYQNLLGEIRKMHGALDEIFLFPAIPAPIAIMCGRELLKKAHPTMKVYDLDKKKGGFNFILSVN